MMELVGLLGGGIQTGDWSCLYSMSLGSARRGLGGVLSLMSWESTEHAEA